MNKICKYCNTEFSKKKTCSKKDWLSRKYCSQTCSNRDNKQIWNKFSVWITPWNKWIPWKKWKENKMYSSIEKNCIQCWKVYTVRNYRKNESKYCSHKCSSDYRNKWLTTESYKERKSIRFIQWRNSVFKRDNYKCRKCSLWWIMNAHHILNFKDNKDLRYELDNWITLCSSCHLSFHKQYWFTNNWLQQILLFIATWVQP